MKRKKDKVAIEKGAAGVINISDQDYTKYWTEKQDFQKKTSKESPRSPLYDKSLALPSDKLKDKLLKINASKKIVNKILENQGIDIENLRNN